MAFLISGEEISGKSEAKPKQVGGLALNTRPGLLLYITMPLILRYSISFYG